MLSLPTPASRSLDEATILQVDHQRCLCKVKTLRGQILTSVRWVVPFGGSTRGSDRFSPHMGDRVVVEHGLGSPIILGFIPRIQTGDGATPIAIHSGEVAVDTGNYSPGGGVAVADQNKPKDSVGGDRLLSSVGGALLGLLRGGSILLRSSRMAEVFLSKYLSLVRIVSRNWEHFTDVSSDVVKNFKGRVYRFTGYGVSFNEAKNEQYRYNLYYGDVAAAQAVKTDYLAFNGDVPPNESVFKEQTLDELTREVMYRTVKLNGDEELLVRVIVAEGEDPIFVRLKNTGNQISLSYADMHNLTLDKDSIHAVRQDGADFILDKDGVRASFEGGVVKVDGSEVSLTKSGHFAKVSASGVALG